MNVIELKQVSKTFHKGLLFKPVPILKDLNFTVKSGEFVVLRGENGAGKTTVLNLILGLIKPSQGEVNLMELPPHISESKVRVGVVLQDTQVPKNIKVKELIELVRSYYPNRLTTSEILSKVNLTYKQDTCATDLSGGQRQRLYFALALAGNPSLLILDEPTRNLDDQGYEEFWEQIKICRQQGITILMVTNNKADWKKLEGLVTRMVILQKLSEVIEGEQLQSHYYNPLASFIQEKPRLYLEWATVGFPYFLKPELLYGLEDESELEQPQQNIALILLKQFWFETLQLVRTPSFLLASASGVLLLPLFKYAGLVSENAVKPLVSLCAVFLFTIIIELLGNRVAVERAEGWLKLLKATPLPSSVYIATKIATLLTLASVILVLLFSVGIWQLEIHQSFEWWSKLFFTIIIGLIPFGLLFLGLGYWLEPKSASTWLTLMLVVAIFASGSMPIPNAPSYVQDLIAVSPFYHYQQLVSWIAEFDYDNQLFLHLLWMVWAASAFGLFASWSYQRDQVVQ
ncbi:ABC transporter family protein [Lyngbya aestuarii BL J]|uniref:ABC transporter family protein n=1 Tax=Lyngbya aestuarii BL J TaxID=1348334 RepID=U7QJ32_9CYAN|nr:ABC transporter ATP-binding protein/permease [Lyngbya aestuarii]ERT07110.1 ABC transporter family protein [Lyngbya aestuarii BL J]